MAIMAKRGMLLWIALNVIGAAVGETKVQCAVTPDAVGQLFLGETVPLPNEKIVLAEWNPGNEDCKFKFVANLTGGFKYATFAVGPHPNPSKYFRHLDLDKYPGQVSQRGYHCKDDCKGPITTFDYDIGEDGGPTYATVREIAPGSLYVIESDLCQVDGKPKYNVTYNVDAQNGYNIVALEIDAIWYLNHHNEMTGICNAG